MKKNKPDILENLLKIAPVFIDKGLRRLRFSKEKVSFSCPHCNKTVKIKI
jgi:hypothetical protein